MGETNAVHRSLTEAGELEPLMQLPLVALHSWPLHDPIYHTLRLQLSEAPLCVHHPHCSRNPKFASRGSCANHDLPVGVLRERWLIRMEKTRPRPLSFTPVSQNYMEMVSPFVRRVIRATVVERQFLRFQAQL